MEKSIEMLEIFLRTLGLQCIDIRRYRQTMEPPKVGVHHDRGVAFIRSSIHFLPTMAAIALMAINFTGLLVLWSPWYASLQFVAKALECLMQASLLSVKMDIIQRRLVESASLPFGAIFSGLMITTPRCFW